jgi:Ras-related protein Rab-39B
MNEAKLHIEPHRAVFILVGCKLDLKEQREVSSEEAERFANFNEMPFVETSAKTGINLLLLIMQYHFIVFLIQFLQVKM